MDAVVKTFPKRPCAEKRAVGHVRAAPQPRSAPSRDEAEAAVRTLLAYIGDNPDREGLVETPKRFVDAYEELFAATANARPRCSTARFARPAATTTRAGARHPFYSHCEHHMMPFTGKAHIAYMPIERVVGLSKIARLIDVYARACRRRST
jgi:GTP cyclohydrolase I